MEKELIILAIYINVNGLSRQHTQQQIHEFIMDYKDMYKDINKDIKIYWFPVNGEQQTRVECVYPPTPINNGNIENELLKIYKLLLNGKNNEAKEIMQHIERRLKINNLKNEH